MTQIEILPLYCKWKKSKDERRHPLMLNEYAFAMKETAGHFKETTGAEIKVTITSGRAFREHSCKDF